MWINGESGSMHAKRKSTSAILKCLFFRATTLHNHLFSEPRTVYCGKHVTFRLVSGAANVIQKEIKVSKSEETSKVDRHIIVESVHMLLDKKLTTLVVLFESIQIAKVGAFFRHIIQRKIRHGNTCEKGVFLNGHTRFLSQRGGAPAPPIFGTPHGATEQPNFAW